MTTKGHVMIIDDEPAVLLPLARWARKVGFTVDELGDGRTAIERLAVQRPDVILCDISMPGMDGIQVLQAVRALDPDLPVVLITGAPDVETAMKAVEFGALRYVTKPIEMSALLETLSYAIGLRGMARLKNEALAAQGIGGRLATNRAGLEASFALALERLWMAFQPIVDWSNRSVFGFEALMRSAEPTLPHPLIMLEAATLLGRLPELGRAVRNAVATVVAGHASPSLIFVNLHPRDLLDDDLYRADAPLSQHAARIVLEVTERLSLADIGDMRQRTQTLRKLGFRLAVDDLGSGYSGLSSMVLVQPEIVKLDMSLIRDIDREPTKQRLVSSMTQLCADMNVVPIAEGIESEGERDMVASLGCTRMQGYLFGRPARELTPPPLGT
ncbi:MAG: EAL domain-containing protein [Myxococcota bacterium]